MIQPYPYRLLHSIHSVYCSYMNILTDTLTITANIPSALAAQLDAISRSHERPRDWAIHEAIAYWVCLQEQLHQETLDALAEADRGEVVDHVDVVKWVNSLNTDTPLPMPRPLTSHEAQMD